MLYAGQEVGEPALGSEGFAGDDGRTTIFDYWSMPEFCRWVNGGKFDGGRLSVEQQLLRSWYVKWMGVLKERAFEAGEFYGLNHANVGNPAFGRLEGEMASGHWLYAYLRRDPEGERHYLVVAHFHGERDLDGVCVQVPRHAQEWLGIDDCDRIEVAECLYDDWEGEAEVGRLDGEGIALPAIPACQVRVLEIRGVGVSGF